MTEEHLEGDKPKEEVVEPTPVKEGEKPTPKGEKPTVSITETPEFRKELDKALGKSTESLQRQATLAKQAENAAKAEVEQHKATVQALETDLQDVQKQLDELAERQFAEDPEAKRAFVDRRAIAEEKRKVAKAKAEAEQKLYDAEKLAWSVGMARKADEVVKETGIDPKELEECQTEEEMEVKGLRFQITQKTGEKEPEKKPKFDSTPGGGGGQDWRNLSADEKLKQGFRRLKEK